MEFKTYVEIKTYDKRQVGWNGSILLWFFYNMWCGITSLEGKDKLKVYIKDKFKMSTKSPKATAKITKWRIISNKPTKEIK